MSATVTHWRIAVLLAVCGLACALPVAGIIPALSSMAPALAEGERGVFLSKLVVTVPGLAMMVGGPCVGWCVERIGNRPVLLLALVAYLVAGLAGYVINNAWMLIAARFVVGLAAAAMLTITYSLVSYYFEGQARARLLGFLSATMAGLGILIALVAGAMVKQWGWHSVFLLFGMTVLPMAAAFWAITDHNGERSPIRPAPAPQSERVPLSALLGIYAIGLWIAIITSNPGLQFPFLLVERGVNDPSMAALVVMSLTAAMFIAAPFYGWLSVRLSIRLLIALMLILCGVGHLLAGVLSAFAAMLVGTALVGVATAFIQPVCTSYIFANFPENAHGRAIGGMISCLMVGQFINPFVITPLNVGLGLAPAAVFLGGLNVVAALAFIVVPRHFGAAAIKG